MSAAASAPEVVHIDSDDGDVTTCIDLTGADAFRVGLRSPLGTRRVLVRPEHTVSHLRRVAANLLGLRQTPKLELTKSTNLSDGSTMARLGVRRGDTFRVITRSNEQAGPSNVLPEVEFLRVVPAPLGSVAQGYSSQEDDASSESWTCARCTLQNTAGHNCDACGFQKPSADQNLLETRGATGAVDVAPEAGSRSAMKRASGDAMHQAGGMGGAVRSYLPSPPSVKRQKRSIEASPILPKMQQGAIQVEPSLSDLDMVKEGTTAPKTTQLLLHLFPGVAKTATNKWRISYTREHPQGTLWSLVAAFDDSRRGALAKQAGKASSTHRRSTKDEGGNGWRCHHDEFAQDHFGITGAEVEYLERRLKAAQEQRDHEQALEQIAPLEGEACSSGAECCVCCENFALEECVHCEGVKELHFMCKPCFRQYAVITVQSGDHTAVPCCDPGCGALYAGSIAARGLGPLDILTMGEREAARNRRVALAAKAVLRCVCGTVGVVLEEDLNDGGITCPGCSTKYCAKCGNDAHPTKDCPPPAETVAWLSKHGKPCPNCHNIIQKNGGCQHMHCAPPGGCGFHFCWGCLKPMMSSVRRGGESCNGCGR